MEFKTLAHLDTKDIVSVFNHSFSDYIVPFHLTEAQLISKMNAEKIDLNLSAGAFEAGALKGFILSAEKEEDGQRLIYNAGTGVVPESRGKGLVRKMYDFILSLPHEKKIDVLMLEVITGNEPAIRAYENLGFSLVRKLLCFHGEINPLKNHAGTDITIREGKGFQWEIFRSFWDIEPSWQGSVFVLDAMKDSILLEAYHGEKPVGYLIYHPGTRKIYQVAVDKNHRNQGIATRLFEALRNNINGQPVSFNNVDASSENTRKFLEEKTGLKNWVSQFEMKRFL